MRTLLALTLCFFLVGFLAAQYAPSVGQEHRQHQEQQDRTDIEQQERGTRDVMDETGLPATASPLPLVGLLSLLSMGGAVTIRALRK